MLQNSIAKIDTQMNLPISDVNYINLLQIFSTQSPEWILQQLQTMQPLDPNLEAQVEFLLSKQEKFSSSSMTEAKEVKEELKKVVVLPQQVQKRKAEVKQSLSPIVLSKRPKQLAKHPKQEKIVEKKHKQPKQEPVFAPAKIVQQPEIPLEFCDWLATRSLYVHELKQNDFVMTNHTFCHYGQMHVDQDGTMTIIEFAPYALDHCAIRHDQCDFHMWIRLGFNNNYINADFTRCRHLIQGFSKKQLDFWFEKRTDSLKTAVERSFRGIGYDRTFGNCVLLGIDNWSQSVTLMSRNQNVMYSDLDVDFSATPKNELQQATATKFIGSFALRLHFCIPIQLLQIRPQIDTHDAFLNAFHEQKQAGVDEQIVRSTLISYYLFFCHKIQLIAYQEGKQQWTQMLSPENSIRGVSFLGLNSYELRHKFATFNAEWATTRYNDWSLCRCLCDQRYHSLEANVKQLSMPCLIAESVKVKKIEPSTPVFPMHHKRQTALAKAGETVEFEMDLICDIDPKSYRPFTSWLLGQVWGNNSVLAFQSKTHTIFKSLSLAPIHFQLPSGALEIELTPTRLMTMAQRNPFFKIAMEGSDFTDQETVKNFTKDECQIRLNTEFVLTPFQCQAIRFMAFQEWIPSLHRHLFQFPTSDRDKEFTVRCQDQVMHLNDNLEPSVRLVDVDDVPENCDYGVLLTEKDRKERSGGVLALEMRLGKTIIVLAMIQYMKQLGKSTGPTLILGTVTSLAGGFLMELPQKFPLLRWCNMDDSKTQHLVYDNRDIGLQYLKSMDVVICQWTRLSALSTRMHTASSFYEIEFDRIVVDEAQNFVSKNSSTFKCFECLRSKHVWLLTGTPFSAKNRVTTLGPLFNACWGEILSMHAYKELNSVKKLTNNDKRHCSRFLRFVEGAFLVFSQHDVQSSTSERKHIAIVHEIGGAVAAPECKAFHAQYQKLIDKRPTKNVMQKSMNLQSMRFVDRLRALCSSFLDVDALLDELLMQSSPNASAAVANKDNEVKSLIPKNSVIFSGDCSKPNEFAKKSDDCPICLDQLMSPFMLPCHHLLCSSCVLEALLKCANFITCVNRCGDQKDNHGITIANKYQKYQLKKVLWQDDYDAMVAREEAKKQQSNIISTPVATAATTFSNETHPKLMHLSKQLQSGRFINLNVSSNNSSSNSKKLLIFSDMLATQIAIAEMLTKDPLFQNRFLRLSTDLTQPKRLKLFQTFADEKSGKDILILPVSIGSLGVDLSVADEAIAFEPFMDASKDQQSINRLYHIRKEKTIKIHYFVMKNSIEETILQQLPLPFEEIRTVRDSAQEGKEEEEAQQDEKEVKKQKQHPRRILKKKNIYNQILQAELQVRRGAEITTEIDLDDEKD